MSNRPINLRRTRSGKRGERAQTGRAPRRAGMGDRPATAAQGREQAAGMTWRMTRKGYYIARELPGGRAGIVSEQRGSGLWRFVVRDRESGAEVRRGDSFQDAPAAMDAAESSIRPAEPDKAVAAQVIEFMRGQDEQQQTGKEG